MNRQHQRRRFFLRQSRSIGIDFDYCGDIASCLEEKYDLIHCERYFHLYVFDLGPVRKTSQVTTWPKSAPSKRAGHKNSKACP